jgi:hypothetical protein
MNKKIIEKDFINELSKNLSKERVDRAKREAKNEIFKIKLSELRKNQGIKQNKIINFTQSSISKIESRKDMKLSTLIDYLDKIGMGVEIKVYKKNLKKDEKILLIKS